MSELHQQWVRAMRGGDHEGAWAISALLAAQRRPQERDDQRLPYHLRWLWDLCPLEGRQVLVRCYHGLGDTIQFLRFLPELRRRAASVTLEIHPRLISLLGREPPADRVVGFDVAHPLPRAECDVEIMELSFALRARPEDFTPPYLSVPPAPPEPEAVGLCSMAGGWDDARSMPADLLAPLCRGRACYTLYPQPSTLPVRNPAGCPFDMRETAALVARMALVITVDTMIAHLAGAMGKPTWLLLRHDPDWRWAPRTGRSEWYPSMRLYVQPRPGDWASVAQAVRRDLDLLIPPKAPAR